MNTLVSCVLYFRAEGGRGALELAEAVIAACDKARLSPSPIKYLYPIDAPIKVPLECRVNNRS